MSKKTVKAHISWVPFEEGGRKRILPVGMRYCPIIVFEFETAPKTLWSAEVYNTAITGNASVADVSYLADDAPYHLLQPRSKFFLYEGQRVVAEGVIV
ncbi:MAG: hypothetical protein LBI36_07015 [Oscillospiraceae bacterium]|jgi:hypothetical protein|nr:hypothetical protein [Oscillospiraceae bacterium]